MTRPLTVLVTGATGGLGRALCEWFNTPSNASVRPVNLIVHGRDEERLRSLYPKSTRIVADLSEYSELLKMAQKVAALDIDILINNAAIVCPGLPLGEVTDEYIKNSINVNLAAPIILSKYAFSSVVKNKGIIVNINSMAGLEPKKHRTTYCATKSGLRGFGESLRLSDGVHILDVYPTNIKTYSTKENAMDLQFVIQNIMDAITTRKNRLILDGRSGTDSAHVN